MPNLKLTKRNVDALRPGAKPEYVFDTDLPGFFLRIMPTGAKAWGFQYRAGSGRGATKQRVTIAAHGKLTPDEARAAAKRLSGEVACGRDPAEAKAQQARETKIAALIDLYEAEGCVVQRGQRLGEAMKPLTKQYTLARLRNHVIPVLGAKRVSEVGTADVERLARDITAGKTARDQKTGPRTRVMVQGGEGAARKVVRDLSAVFTFAVRRKLAASNPVTTAAVRKTDNRRERFLSLGEVQRLGAALDALEAKGRSPKALNIARLWVLTGCRRNEIAGLRWTEVDIPNGLLTLAVTKTGRSIRPLSASAAALLTTIPAEQGSPFVFPAVRGDGHFSAPKTVWSEAVKLADLPGITPHTLRHTMGGIATSTGEALAMTGAILGHANARSTEIYAHVERDPARKAADRVGAQIAAALNGEILTIASTAASTFTAS